jgi:serine/threonine protein kinase
VLGICLRRNQNKLKVSPKGIRINDLGLGLSENEVRSAAIAVLRCLGYIHSKGFVHRDIRWSNIIKLVTYTPQNVASESFMVIDFEFAAKDGDAMEISNYIHNRIVNYGEFYFARHDLKLVAKLVNTWAVNNNIALTANAQRFVDSISGDVGNLPAEEALQHFWLH